MQEHLLYMGSGGGVAWTKGSDIPKASSFNTGITVWSDSILVCGGGNDPNVLKIYDTLTDTWTQKPLPKPVHDHTAVTVFEDELWTFGGWDGTVGIREINVFDLSVDPIALKQMFPLPYTSGYWRSGVSIHVRKDLNKMLVIGGEYGDSADWPVMIVNTNNGTITTGPNVIKRNCSTVMVGNEIWLLGGSNSTTSTTALDTVQKYNVVTNSLTTESVKLAPPRGSNGSTAIGDLIYMMGGFTTYDSRHSGTRVLDKDRIVSFNTLTKEFKPLLSNGKPPEYIYAPHLYSLQSVNGDLYWLDGYNFYKGVIY